MSVPTTIITDCIMLCRTIPSTNEFWQREILEQDAEYVLFY